MAPKRKHPTMAATHDPSMRSDLAPAVHGDTVTVLVGKDERKFLIHETPLRAHSRFFDAAMSGAWRESTDRVVKLPVEDAACFNIYVQWLYTNKTTFAEDHHFCDVVSLFLTASRMQDGDCQDAAIDCMIRRTKRIPAMGSINRIYTHTVSGDPVRKLLVDCVAIRGKERFFSKPVEAVDAQFYYDLAKLLIMEKTGKEPEIRLSDEDGSTCKYHQHGDSECYSTKYAA